LRDFGLSVGKEAIQALTRENQILRMGVPPLRIELLTSISGVDFEDCHARRILVDIGELSVPIISLEDLKTNKRSSGRMKDLADLEELEG
jgi:hypothetical protein